jgi:tetratricopeptide (TPR) repeat protein
VTTNGKKRGAQGYSVGTKQAPARRAKPARKRQDHQLFSDKIRKQGRWVFLGLAIVFGMSFILFGVGNVGGIGLNDLLQNGGGGGGSSTKETATPDALNNALKAAQAKQSDPQAWAAVGAAYTTVATSATDPAAARDAYEKATIAYKKASDLKPSDANLQTQLAQAYSAQAAAVEAQIQDLLTEAQAASGTDSGASQFTLPKQSPDAFQSAIDSAASENTSAIYDKITPLSPIATTARNSALAAWLKVTALKARDPNAWFQMASAAAAAGDKKNQLAGYKQFLLLVPNDPLAAPVKSQVDSLEGKTTPAPAATGGSTGSTSAGSSTGG